VVVVVVSLLQSLCELMTHTLSGVVLLWVVWVWREGGAVDMTNIKRDVIMCSGCGCCGECGKSMLFDRDGRLGTERTPTGHRGTSNDPLHPRTYSTGFGGGLDLLGHSPIPVLHAGRCFHHEGWVVGGVVVEVCGVRGRRH
jgi:hypothetical protein